MVQMAIVSVYKTLRSCVVCGEDFLPPRRPDNVIAICCSSWCGFEYKRRRDGFPPRPIPAPADRIAARVDTVARAPRRLRVKEGVPIWSQNIIRNRERMTLTQQQLADRLEVHKNTVNGWEVGRSIPPITKFAAMARLFGVTLDALYYPQGE